MKRKLSKEGKKRISHEDRSWWDVWSFLFWRGEGRKRIEERKQKKQPQDNKLCVKQKIIPFEGHFLWVTASGRKETEIKHWRESPHLLMKHPLPWNALEVESFLVLWGMCRSQQTVWMKLCPLPPAHWPNMVRDRLISGMQEKHRVRASPGCWVQDLRLQLRPGGTQLLNRDLSFQLSFLGAIASPQPCVGARSARPGVLFTREGRLLPLGGAWALQSRTCAPSPLLHRGVFAWLCPSRTQLHRNLKAFVGGGKVMRCFFWVILKISLIFFLFYINAVVH